MAKHPAYCGRIDAIESSAKRSDRTLWLGNVDPNVTDDALRGLLGTMLAVSCAGPTEGDDRLTFERGRLLVIGWGRRKSGCVYLNVTRPARDDAGEPRNGEHLYLAVEARAWELAQGKPPKVLGRIKPGSNVSTPSFALEDPSDSLDFEVGMRIALSSWGPEAFSRAGVRCGEAVVCGIDRERGIVTVQGNLAANICAAAAYDFVYCAWEVEAFRRKGCPCEGKPLARGSCGLCGRPALPPVAGIGVVTGVDFATDTARPDLLGGLPVAQWREAVLSSGRRCGKTQAQTRWVEAMRAEGRHVVEIGPTTVASAKPGELPPGCDALVVDVASWAARQPANRERVNNELDRKFVEAVEDAERDTARGISMFDVGRWTIATYGAAPALLAPVVTETCGGCGKMVAPGAYCPCGGEAEVGCADCGDTGTRVSATRGRVPCECGEHVSPDPYTAHAHAQILKARETAAQVHHPKMHASRLESIEQETEVARRDLARLRAEATLRTAAADELERVLAEFGRPGKVDA